MTKLINIESVKVYLENLKSFHHRIMMRYLQKRGWVVFYLDEEHRKPCNDDSCYYNLFLKDK